MGLFDLFKKKNQTETIANLKCGRCLRKIEKHADAFEFEGRHYCHECHLQVYTNINQSNPIDSSKDMFGMECFRMWNDRIVFADQWFIFMDGKGRNSIISQARAQELEETYQRYQASQDVQRGGAEYDIAYSSRGFVKKDDRLIYEKYRVDTLITGNMYTIQKELVIPERISGIPINFVSNSAFKGKTKIEKVILHKNITEIENSAFEGCSNLSDIIISNENTIIRENAFKETKIHNFSNKERAKI